MEKKKIDFRPSKFEGCMDFYVDDKKVNSCNYPNQVSLVIRKEFGLSAIHNSDINDHPEWLAEYVQHSSKEMLNDRYYTHQADKFYDAEGWSNSISTCAASFITYDYYKKLQDAGFNIQASFLAAFHHHWFTTLGMEYKKEHDEISRILNKKD